MARVAVVTDSTTTLPASELAALGVRVVPLRVTLGARTVLDDGVEVTTAEIVAALRERRTVSTSRPSPAEFARTFRTVLDGPAERVVSVHLSAALSGTWESATLAAQDFPHGAVRVVDSRSTAMGLGFAVLEAARCAADGGSAADVQEAATAVVDRTRTLFSLDTLEHLRRGGRIGAAQAFVATSLSVKPLLQMVEGQIVPMEKVRTATRATARLVDLVAGLAGDDAVDLAVHHLGVPERADQLRDQLQAAVPAAASTRVAELGAVIGAHLGPGTLGVVLARRP